MILLSHPTGNANVRQAALALARAQMLQELWTSISWDVNGPLHRRLPANLQQELGRRAFPDELKSFLKTAPFREIGRQISSRARWRFAVERESAPFSIESVYYGLDCKVARRLRAGALPAAVYGYDDGSLETFRAAKKRGIRCIYEHPIAHWRKVREIQQEEAQLSPEWIGTLGALGDSEAKLARKDEELALADLIIVASSFSGDSLNSAPHIGGPIKVIPYGAPDVAANAPVKRRAPSTPLKVLFVGGLSQSKGLGYLLTALKPLANYVELTLIGKRVHPEMPTDAMLQPWNWLGSVPHQQVLQIMEEHDVLVFPSLHEGFGLVILEALSRGLPVIATENCGAPDVMTDGKEGFILPIRSSEGITNALQTLLDDAQLLSQMSENALLTARAYCWKRYEDAFVETLSAFLKAE